MNVGSAGARALADASAEVVIIFPEGDLRLEGSGTPGDELCIAGEVRSEGRGVGVRVRVRVEEGVGVGVEEGREEGGEMGW